MKKAGIPPGTQTAYLKWLRYFLDFCGKHHFEPSDPDSAQAFTQKLSDKGQSLENQKQAADTAKVYRQIVTNEFSRTAPTAPKADRESPTSEENWSTVRQKLKETVLVRNYSKRTFRAYAGWIERLAQFLPGKTPAEVILKEDRVREWLSKGAKPTLTVSQLLEKKGIRV